MTKAILYDETTGLVYRCMFTGLNSKGQARWVNISPNEDTVTFVNTSSKTSSNHLPLKVISVDNEPVSTEVLVWMINNLIKKNDDLYPVSRAFNRLKEMGVIWEKDLLSESVTVTKYNTEYPYNLHIETKSKGKVIDSINLNFVNLSALFETMESYFAVKLVLAELPIIHKILNINKKLKNKVDEHYLNRFNKVIISD